MKILFITWDGPQVSYLEGLFLPIFRRLAEHGLKFHVLQYTWGEQARLDRIQSACEAADVPYRPVRIWRKPVGAGAVLTAVVRRRAIRAAIRDWGIDLVMPRSVLPALATLVAVRGRPIPMVFDGDGLPLDERVDFGGQSSSGMAYRFLRDIEAEAARQAELVLTRTPEAAEILYARGGAGTKADRFAVVGNGRDPERYTPGVAETREATRCAMGISPTSPLLVYSGSLGLQYCLPEMLTLFERVLARRSDARLLILTASPEIARERVVGMSGVECRTDILTVEPSEVPAYLAAGDLGLALRAQSFSMRAVAPIKIGEYMLCGVPVVATAGIGDASELTEDVRFATEKLDRDDLDRAANWFVENVLPRRDTVRDDCRKAGLKYYSLDAAVESYRRAFSELQERCQ